MPLEGLTTCLHVLRCSDLPLTPSGLEKMLDNLGLSKVAAKKLFQRSKASDPRQLLKQLPDLVRTVTQIATFDAKIKRTKTHQHLYLPKDYSGSPTTSLYTPWTEAEVLAHLTAGWGESAISELRLEYLYGLEHEVSV